MTYIASMTKSFPMGPLAPPPGRPNWGGGDGLPLLYLGWGQRDFERDPLAMHCDRATTYFVLLRGEIVVRTEARSRTVRAPACLIFDTDCAFGLTQPVRRPAEILVWIWRGRAVMPEISPKTAEYLVVDLRSGSLDPLASLHLRCRDEVARADGHVPYTLQALHTLMEVEIVRASHISSTTGDVRWNLANSWMLSNLSIHAPVPALCDYLRMSASTVHRYFLAHCGLSPAAYFRNLKLSEARRLIEMQGWQVKAAAIQLGYRHANDLSRALSKRSMTSSPSSTSCRPFTAG